MFQKTILTALILLSFIGDSCSPDRKTNENMTAENTVKPVKSGYAPLHGIKMYYEIYGKGAPLVLIHGGGSTIQTSFGRIIPELSGNRQLIAVELQGHGHTPDVDRPETFVQDADDVAALLNYLKIEKADFFGFSNGAHTTLEIAIRHPELIRKIILGSVAYNRNGMPAEFWKTISTATLKDMPQPYQDAYKEVAPDTNDLIKMFEKDRNRMIEFKGWTAEEIRAIKAPALIISGDQDVVSPEHAVEMHRLLSGSHLIILPGGHGKYMGELATLSEDGRDTLIIVPLIEEFLN
jgi:pimeloyl-ACP methyl ester carboxylesterase